MNVIFEYIDTWGEWASPIATSDQLFYSDSHLSKTTLGMEYSFSERPDSIFFLLNWTIQFVQLKVGNCSLQYIKLWCCSKCKICFDRPWQDLNLQSPVSETDALSIRPQGRYLSSTKSGFLPPPKISTLGHTSYESIDLKLWKSLKVAKITKDFDFRLLPTFAHYTIFRKYQGNLMLVIWQV